MCRYAFKTYKSHYACFDCRKTFKQALYSDLLLRIGKLQYYERLLRKPVKQLSDKEGLMLAELNKKYKNRAVKCPQCGSYMADLGLDFKSPKKTAIKEWDIIAGLYTIGKSFHSCGCYGIGFIPKKTKDYILYLERKLQEYENCITQLENKTSETYPDKAERFKYWGTRVRLIKQELILQKQLP